MSNCHCPDDDMNDDRNWSEEECSRCPLCRSKARKAAAKALLDQASRTL